MTYTADDCQWLNDQTLEIPHIVRKQLSAKAESFYLSSLQSNSTLGRFTTALGLSADSPIPAGFDLHSSRCAHGDHSADKRNDASSVRL